MCIPMATLISVFKVYLLVQKKLKVAALLTPFSSIL